METGYGQGQGWAEDGNQDEDKVKRWKQEREW